MTIITIYQNDFRKRNNSLLDKQNEIRILIRQDKIDALDLNELDVFCRDEWKKLIKKAIREIKHEINSRLTKGLGFSNILFQLQKIDEDLIEINDYKIEWFENVYFSDIVPLRQDAKEKIKNERFIIIFSIIIPTIFFFIGKYYG